VLGTIALLLYASKKGKEKKMLNHFNHTISMLAGATTVDGYLLAEDDNILEMIANGETIDTMVAYINENY